MGGGYCRAVSTALYRRYRPESFADVIGQEHVTEPLMQALRTGRIHHAYLFSGPRGCGKTTSARILARCLNCAQGPTDTPCGVCDSCVGLARDGSGTVDVIEIDAASHGGVDDARDLREKASFGPAASRYKIYIIDEAHMVTPAGFNALLKVVEEPPPHVKFVFATTEPEKVIGTIRSRTHHYPFRLVPPARLQDYLAQLAAAEGVEVAKGVLPLVVRAGAGSVRDSLSVLDQLIAGSSDDGISYERAVGLLGYTDAALLDSVVEAFAAGDGATVFTVVDRVIESGHEPRRFVEDLLERLRDLVVISAVPDGAASILRGVPEDQLDRMRQQATHFGPAALSRAADVVNTGLTELTGATSPRLQLELLCARVLLPGAEGESGYGARLDRIERRLNAVDAGTAERATPAPAAAATPTPAVAATRTPAAVATRTPAAAPSAATSATPASDAWSTATSDVDSTAASAAPTSSSRSPAGAESASASREPARAAATPPPRPAERATFAAPPAAAPTSAPGAIDADAIRTAWPRVVDRLFGMKKATWSLVKEHAKVLDFDGRRLLLGISSPGLTTTFRGGAHGEFVRQALIDELAVDAQVEAVHGDTPPSRQAAGSGRAGGRPVGGSGGGAGASSGLAADVTPPARATGSRPTAGSPEPSAGAASGVSAGSGGRSGSRGPVGAASERPAEHVPERPIEPPGWDDVPPPTEEPGDPEPVPDPRAIPDAPAGPNPPGVPHAPAVSNAQPQPAGRPAANEGSAAPSGRDPGTGGGRGAGTASARGRSGDPGRTADPSSRRVAPADDEPSADDADADDSGLVGRPVVERLLGGRVIDETPA